MTQNQRFAAILNAVLSVLGIVLSIVPLAQYGTDMPSDQPPFVVLLLGILFGIVGLIGSYGIWKGARWGVILTIVIRAVDLLLSIPGLFVSDAAWLFVWALVSVIGDAAVIVLLVWKRNRETAPASS